jgi:hypothetical protein
MRFPPHSNERCQGFSINWKMGSGSEGFVPHGLTIRWNRFSPSENKAHGPIWEDEYLIGGMKMEKEDRDRGRPHLDPLEQATEALPKRDRYSREEAKETERLDHEE